MENNSSLSFFKENEKGAAVFDHLAEVVMKILIEKPEDPLSEFEIYSTLIKSLKENKNIENNNVKGVIYNKTLDERKNWVSSTFPMFKKPVEEGEDEKEEEAEEEEEMGEPGTIQDVVHELDALQWAGIGIGEEDAIRIYLSLIRLSSKTGGINLRFWGKILGTKKDYYIAESDAAEAGEEEEENEDIEPEGPNRNTYYASNSVGGPWIKLPRVSSTQIREARKIKRYFSGDFEAVVPGHPPFPGREKDYLRAQIARITSSTMICPAGIYRLVDPEDPKTAELTPEDEMEKIDLNKLINYSGWVHYTNEINILGKTTLKTITNEDGEEIIDPNGPALIPILASIESEMNNWTIRVNPTISDNIPPKIVCLRCNRWSGAYTVGFGTKFTNIYIGYGVKNGKENYSPEPPFALMTEYNPEEYSSQNDVYEDPNPPKPVEEEGQEEAQEKDDEEDDEE